MKLIMSPSEIALVCKAIQHEIPKHELFSDTRNEYAKILGMLCDEVEVQFRQANHEEFYQIWLNEYDLLPPY